MASQVEMELSSLFMFPIVVGLVYVLISLAEHVKKHCMLAFYKDSLLEISKEAREWYTLHSTTKNANEVNNYYSIAKRVGENVFSYMMSSGIVAGCIALLVKWSDGKFSSNTVSSSNTAKDTPSKSVFLGGTSNTIPSSSSCKI
jgi:hypothetical protein